MQWAEIEELIRSRKVQAARAAIVRYAKTRKRDSEALFQACEGLRRLGLFKQGLSLLALEPGDLARIRATNTLEGKKALWAARFLNLLGASEFALQLVRNLRGGDPLEHRILGNIYLTNFEYASAVEHFEKMRALQKGDTSYSARLSLLALADAWAGVGRLKDSVALAQDLYHDSKKNYPRQESLFLGICLQARGEYLARLGETKPARAILQEAFQHFPKDDRTADFGFLCKWAGYTEVDPALALKHFERALSILKAPNVRPEAWLDVHRLQALKGQLSADEAWWLRAYPTACEGFRRQFAPHGAFTLRARSARWHFDLTTGEHFKQGTASLTTPKELELVALAALSGPWGLNVERAKCLLWPDELFSYEQLDERLKKLVQRAQRPHRLGLQIDDGWIRLSEADRDRLSVTLSNGSHLPSFLDGHSEFGGSEFGSYYELSRTQRAVHIKNWQAHGWISAQGRPPRLRYRRAKNLE